MNASFPIDLYDRLAPRGRAVVEVSAADAERLQAFLVGMNKLDLLLREVDLDQLTGPGSDELRAFLRYPKGTEP